MAHWRPSGGIRRTPQLRAGRQRPHTIRYDRLYHRNRATGMPVWATGMNGLGPVDIMECGGNFTSILAEIGGARPDRGVVKWHLPTAALDSARLRLPAHSIMSTGSGSPFLGLGESAVGAARVKLNAHVPGKRHRYSPSRVFDSPAPLLPTKGSYFNPCPEYILVAREYSAAMHAARTR